MLVNLFNNNSRFPDLMNVELTPSTVREILYINNYIPESEIVDAFYKYSDSVSAPACDAKVLVSCMYCILSEALKDPYTRMSIGETMSNIDDNVNSGLISTKDVIDLNSLISKYIKSDEDDAYADRAFITRGMIKYLRVCNR